MTREELIKHLSERDLLIEGHRNDDSVNLAILAYDLNDGNIDGSQALYQKIMDVISEEGFAICHKTELRYLTDKCAVLIRYLPTWYDTGDIYQYAII